MFNLPLGRIRQERGCPLIPSGQYLSSCCQKSRGVITTSTFLLDCNFITLNKEHLQTARIFAKLTYESLKNDKTITPNQRKNILAYLRNTLRAEREILSFESKIDEILSLSSKLSPDARKFISEFFENKKKLSCSTDTKKELIQFTRKIREILKDETYYSCIKGKSQSSYPISRCTGNSEKAITESFSKIPKPLDISILTCLSTPLRAYEKLVSDYNSFTGSVRALTNSLVDRKIGIIS